MPNIGRKGQCPWRGKGDALHPPLLLPAMHTAHFEPACVSAKATVSRMRPRQCASWNGKLQMEKHNQMFGVLGRVLLRRGVGLSAQSFFFPPTVQRRSSTFAKWVGQPLKPQTGAAPARGNQRSAGRSRQAAIHGPTNRWRLVVQMRSDEPGIGLKSGR